MALYGDLTVNGQRIGWWSATRAITGDDGWHLYDCAAAVHGVEWEGKLQHQHDDGAAVLACKVLTAYTTAEYRTRGADR